MVTNRTNYVAKLVGWLNFRYYVIELHNRLYIIDYANPKDARNYFSGFFPKHNRRYTIYDITDTKDHYAIKTVPWWQSPLRQFIELWFAVSLIAIAAISSFLDIEFFRNDDILKLWKLIVLLCIIGAGIIIVGLIWASKVPNQLLTERSFRIERKPQPVHIRNAKKIKRGPVGDFLQLIIGLPVALVFLLNKNYLIIPLGFIAVYSIVFIRFLNLFEILNGNKFIFLEEEEY